MGALSFGRRQWLRLFSAAALGAEPARWPTFAQFERRLREWQREHPSLFRLEVPGRSIEGRPVYAAILTDPDADADTKEHVLFTALHSGIERGATTSALYLMNWLLSGDPRAREILRRQVAVFLAMVNPDGWENPSFTNRRGHDPYLSWTLNGPEKPDEMPEAMAVKAMMDRYQPEVHADLHGNDLSFPGYIHYEGRVHNTAQRAYDTEIERLMDEEALTEGFPSDRREQDAGRLFLGSGLGMRPDKVWAIQPRVFAGTYSYHRYHTIPLASENSFERACFLRHRRLLEIGNQTWPGEYYAGYPARTIALQSHLITAHGRTAAERRRSRVELWNKQGQLLHGFLNPQREGFVPYVCATSPAAAKAWLADTSLKGFVARLGQHPRMNGAALREAFRDHPDRPGQWGPAAHWRLAGRAEAGEAVQHGLSLRLLIPYPKSIVTDLRVNGHPVPAGYLCWVARGYRYVQLDFSPARLREDDLFVVTCKYDPGEKRTDRLPW